MWITVASLSHVEHPPQGVCQRAHGGSGAVHCRLLGLVASDLGAVGVTAHRYHSSLGENMLGLSCGSGAFRSGLSEHLGALLCAAAADAEEARHAPIADAGSGSALQSRVPSSNTVTA